MKKRSTLSVLLSTCVLVLLGCGPERPDYGSLNLSEVHGTVTLDGQPLAGGLVQFQSEDATYSYGTTDESGRYELMFNSEQSGVLKGRKTVRIWSSKKAAAAAENRGEEEGDPDAVRHPAEKVPPQYNSRSTLTANVEKDSEEFNFDLKSR